MFTRGNVDWLAKVHEIGPQFSERAARYDRERTFVADNYQELKEGGFLAAGVPMDLGGGGASHSEVCHMLREMAHYCGSSALALSMHSHLVAATVWKHKKGQPGQELLQRVAKEQRVLVSTGAGDWLESNGEVQAVPGGYRVSATKRFCSGSPVGDILITSAAYVPAEGETQVLHFGVPMTAPGVSMEDDWDTLGMRGTGSNTVKLQDVFIPEEKIVLRRPRSGWHPVWSVVLTVAAPIYTAPYVGIAEAAAQTATKVLRRRAPGEDTYSLLGEMENSLAVARLALQAMIDNAKNYDFVPELSRANTALIHKTLASQAALATVEKACEVLGGASFHVGLGLERLLRDVHGANFHPLSPKRQQRFTGRLALGLEPIG